MSEFSTNLRRILADRHSPEAAALFRTLLGYVHGRVGSTARGRCRGLLSEADVEELSGEVLYQLMRGGLARFRGDSMPELIAFVRVVCDRTTWRVAERRLREREAVADFEASGDTTWKPTAPRRADNAATFSPDSPLSEADRTYLTDLIKAGSKADLARQAGVSRAAVTQRIRRIQDRVAKLRPSDRAAHAAWLEQTASDVLNG